MIRPYKAPLDRVLYIDMCVYIHIYVQWLLSPHIQGRRFLSRAISFVTRSLAPVPIESAGVNKRNDILALKKLDNDASNNFQTLVKQNVIRVRFYNSTI